MSWLDDFGLVAGALSAAPPRPYWQGSSRMWMPGEHVIPPGGGAGYTRTATVPADVMANRRAFGYSGPWDYEGITWGDLAAGMLTNPPIPASPGVRTTSAYGPQFASQLTRDNATLRTHAGLAPIPTPPAPTAASASAAPAPRVDIKLPFSGYAPSALADIGQPPRSTQGDVFGSITGAIGDTVGHLNLGNVVPWMMERVNVLADEASKAPIIGPVIDVAKLPLDIFANGVKAVSDVAAPILDALPSYIRDSQLQDRAKLYRAVISGGRADFGILGPVSNPLSTLAQYGSYLIPGGFGIAQAHGGVAPAAELFGVPVSAQTFQYDQYRQMLLHTVDPNERATIEQRMGILREAIDLPPSVKVAIERNPNLTDAQLETLLSTAPEGRMWSYQGGAPGIVQNIGTPLLLYGGEAKALSLAARGVSAFGSELAAPTASAGLQTVGAGIAAAGKATSIAAKLQTYMVGAGLGYAGLSTTMDAIARYQGNQAAIDWFDRVNRTTKFSDDPAVQLVTSFSVNPFDALKVTTRAARATVGAALHPVAAVRGAAGAVESLIPGRATLSLAHGLGDITVSAETAGRINRFVGSDAPMVDMIRRMYRLGSDAEAQKFLADNYDHRGQAFDEVLGVALDDVLARLPAEERAVINAMHPDPVARTRFVAETYIDSAMKLIEKDPQAVADRWRERSWNYHGYAGRFSPEVAAANARDFRTATARTYQMRSELDAVVGYREAFPPQAQDLARAQLDAITLPDGTMPVGGMQGIDGLIKNFPVLRKYWTGLIAGEERIPRATADRILERAQADWQRLTKQNPVKARTGADPILRPNSPTLSRDTADALGTSIETLDAIDQGAPTADALDLVRRYVVQKLDLTPEQVGMLAPKDVVALAQKHVEQTTRPWRKAGDSVAAAEKDMATVRSELARLQAMPRGVVQPDEIIRLERQYAALNTLVRASSDPIIPFVSEVATAKPGALREGRDIALTELATRRAEATTQLNALQTIHDAGAALAGDDWHTLFRRVEGQVEYSGNLPAMSPAMRSALRLPAGMGDYEAWSTLGNGIDRLEHLLTRAQRRTAHEVLDGGGWRHQDPASRIKASDQATGLGQDAAIEQVARLWAERESILNGTSEYALRRTANLQLPPKYAALADELATTSTERGIVQDPLFAQKVHPGNVARLQDALASSDTFPAAKAIVESDPILSDRYAAFMQREGLVAGPNDHVAAHIDLGDGTRVNFTHDVLSDGDYAPWLAHELIPADFVRPTPGVIVPDGLWDKAILANDKPALAQLARDFKADETPAPPVSTPTRVARQTAANVPKRRPSVRYARRLAEADTTASPDATIMEAPGNRIGMDVLSVMNHGIAGTQPATINRVLELLREMENGNAKRAGIGDGLAAEAQRVANELLDAAVKEAPRPDTTGIFTKGIFPEDEQGLAAEIASLLKYDEANPLGTLQYGLKKRPKAAVVLEWSQVPGLAEELMTSHFQPYAERVGAAQVRQAFNWIFGPRSNEAIRAESKLRFLERATAQGVDAQTASAIHDAWRKVARESRPPMLRRTATGERRYVEGDNPLYADVRNIPNANLDQVAQRTIDELADAGRIDDAGGYLSKLHRVDYAALFRESTSFVRRQLADRGGPLGEDLARAYGMVAHNKAVTTLYYWFRFGLDVRFHAQNFLESQLLYLGRAGLRRGEISQGQLGMTEQYLRNLATDPMSNTGWIAGQDRAKWAYRTFLKEQPDLNRDAIKGLAAEDPALMQRALEQLAAHDPQIVDMRRQFGDSPAAFIAELDRWHEKMLGAASLDENAALIDEALAQAYRESPELAQVWARLHDVNMAHWDDIRSTFYGNPNRSRAERFLNSYLLFWPLSYQIKAAKWYAKVLFDSAGGLPTNAGGAWMLNQLATTHTRLLATDPAYGDWYEKHPTLVFLAQMLLPVNPDGSGVSLSPGLASVFFGKTKSVFNIGPVFTFGLVKRAGPEIYSDVYPTLRDLPGLAGAYAALTGQQPPKTTP